MKIVLMLIILAAGAAGAFQQRAINQVRASIHRRSELAEQAAKLTAENRRLSALTLSTNEITELRAEKTELMKVRSEISSLRKDASLTPEQVRAEIQTARVEIEANQRQVALVDAREEARIKSKAANSLLSSINSVLMLIAHKSEGPMPRSFEEMKAALESRPELETWKHGFQWISDPAATV